MFLFRYRLQADITGQRLKDLNLKYTKLFCSTLIRAAETADIIAKYLPDVPRETCCMLREGAPVTPDPSSKNWKPNKKVSVTCTQINESHALVQKVHCKSPPPSL